MNKLFTISLVALAIVLTSCGTKGSKSVAMSDSLATKGVAYSGKIAFVRMDSLMQGYGMYIDMRDAFTKKQSQMQSELENKGRALEREVGDYQQKAQKGLVTRYQAQTIEEGLTKKQQEIVAYRDKVMGDLSQEEAVMINKISESLMAYLKEYNAQKLYSVIFQTTGGTPILIADPAIDITSEVLVELNKRYLVQTTDAQSKQTVKKTK